MTPALEQIKALPAKWRGTNGADLPPHHPEIGGNANNGRFYLDQCAADLDTALQSLRDEAGEAMALPSDTGPFADWLAREMPPGTVISNPAWWAPRILRQIAYLAGSPAPAAEAAPQGGVEAVMRKVVDGVMAQREEVLRAFVAKYGFQPDEAVQVVGSDGSWRVIRREEMYVATPPSAPAERYLTAEGEVYREGEVEPEIRREFTPCDENGNPLPSEPAEAASDEIQAAEQLASLIESQGFAGQLRIGKSFGRAIVAGIRGLSAPVPQEGVDEAAREVLTQLRNTHRAYEAQALTGTNRAHHRNVANALEAALAAGALPQRSEETPNDPE